tara:strand:+ start:781 stop:984 length:204 start_codon:yes stop_codon:yes gene_type:complete
MSFLVPKMPAPPPPPPPPPKPDIGRARAMAEEALRDEMRRRRGRGSTIVAGALGQKKQTDGTPTLMG